ncbi:MAG: dihydrolipoyl dehydrogenase [Halanaerobiales bacterium]|nr:dihydrolipoyl dehydrogenase [Halanaerobiales bacterium]
MTADITIIGGGPGGYVSALRAAQNGAETVIIEKNKLGGTCLNVGCIPTKALLASTGIANEIKKWNNHGIKIGEVEFEIDKLMQHKNKIVNKLVGGVNSLLNNHENIRLIEGKAELVDKNKVQVTKSDGNNEIIESENIILATGSKPIEIPGFPFSHDLIMDNKDALEIEEIPENILIVGGGVIGVEFANIYNNLGSQVTIIEKMNKLIPTEETVVGDYLKEAFEEEGINVLLNSEVNNWQELDNQLEVSYTQDNENKILTIDKVMIAVGRSPLLEEINLDKIGIEYDRSSIKVNNRMETNIDGIYAVGDLNGNYQLAHVAFQEGITAVDNALGDDKEIDYNNVPRCIYTDPEIAAVGLTEQEANKKYDGNITIGHFPYDFNGKALSGKDNGFVKTIVETEYDQLVGMLIVGSHATELIGQGTFAMTLEGTVETIDDIIFPHPTLSEMIKESTLNSLDMALHI